MPSNYHFYAQNNILGQTTILFKEISHTTEFLKMILQILGMYNFILKSQQDIWQNNQICAELDGPNGSIFITIDAQKNISFAASESQNDILAIESILSKLHVFKKERLEIESFAASF